MDAHKILEPFIGKECRLLSCNAQVTFLKINKLVFATHIEFSVQYKFTKQRPYDSTVLRITALSQKKIFCVGYILDNRIEITIPIKDIQIINECSQQVQLKK